MMMLRAKAASAACLSILGLALLLPTGCGVSRAQHGAILAFSDAAAAMASTASEELRATREDVIAMTTMRLKLGDTAADPAKLDGSLTAERAEARVLAMDALGEYAALLKTLATTDQTDQIQAATTSFTASLKNLKGVSLDTSQLGALGSVVAGIGGMTVEAMRTRAIHAVVPKVHPSIVALAGEIKKDFDPEGEHWSLAYDTEVVMLNGAVNVARKATGPAAPGPTLLAEAEAIAGRNAGRSKLMCQKVTESADALLAAQTNLYYAVQSQSHEISLAEVEQFVGKVQEFVVLARILRGSAP